MSDIGDKGTGLSFAAGLHLAGDNSSLLDPSGWVFRTPSLVALRYEGILPTRALKRLPIVVRQAQIRATVGSVVLQMIKLRAFPLSKTI